jgi:hypothetical protein
VFAARAADNVGLIENLTIPGVAELAVPLDVLTLSHGEPGNTVAVQFAVAFPETVTRKDP